MQINAKWHSTHKIQKSPSIGQRIEWHREHMRHCSCRLVPERLKEEMSKRGLQTFIASEKSLRKDWGYKVDDAWDNL